MEVVEGKTVVVETTLAAVTYGSVQVNSSPTGAGVWLDTVATGDTVLDCGAAEGMFALSVMDRAARLVVFEPWEGFQESLRLTFGSNPRVSVRQQALGEKTAEQLTAEFHQPQQHSSQKVVQ